MFNYLKLKKATNQVKKATDAMSNEVNNALDTKNAGNTEPPLPRMQQLPKNED